MNANTSIANQQLDGQIAMATRLEPCCICSWETCRRFIFRTFIEELKTWRTRRIPLCVECHSMYPDWTPHPKLPLDNSL